MCFCFFLLQGWLTSAQTSWSTSSLLRTSDSSVQYLPLHPTPGTSTTRSCPAEVSLSKALSLCQAAGSGGEGLLSCPYLKRFPPTPIPEDDHFIQERMSLRFRQNIKKKKRSKNRDLKWEAILNLPPKKQTNKRMSHISGPWTTEDYIPQNPFLFRISAKWQKVCILRRKLNKKLPPAPANKYISQNSYRDDFYNPPLP